MFERIRRTEWPLVIFTVGMQLAAGCACAAAYYDGMPDARAGVRSVGMLAGPIAIAAVLASTFHLGRPRSGWKALLNLRTSVLSREVLFSTLFLFAATAYSFCWLAGVQQGRIAIGWIASALGLGAVVLSSMVYLLPTQPLWNSWRLPVSFVATALLLGGIAAEYATGAASVSIAVVIAIACAALLLTTSLALVRRAESPRPQAGARFVTVSYCIVLCVIPTWMAVRLAIAPSTPAVTFANVTLLALLLICAALERNVLYRRDRLPQF